ncbi:hypothetical protein CDD83_6125 [Cordyceps sp. RAO-2017]|nr:hypothetical protein CDD83_6125 [Cordyceps sp. RAO-2017]
MEGQAGSRPPSDPTLVGLGGLGRRAASPSRTTNPGQGPIQGEASYRVELEDELTGSVAVPPASPGLPSTARTPVPRVQGAQSIVEWTDIFFPDHSHGALSTTSALGPSPLPPNAWQYGSPTATGSTRYLGDNGLASCLTGPLFGSSWDDPSSGWYQPTSPGRLSSPSSSFGLPLAQLPTSPLQYSNNLLPQYLFSGIYWNPL